MSIDSVRVCFGSVRKMPGSYEAGEGDAEPVLLRSSKRGSMYNVLKVRSSARDTGLCPT